MGDELGLITIREKREKVVLEVDGAKERIGRLLSQNTNLESLERDGVSKAIFQLRINIQLGFT